jgi:hypothetical protein
VSTSEGKEDESSNNRQKSPRISEIGVNEIGTPLIPGHVAVGIDLHVYNFEAAVWVQRNVLGERVEQFSNCHVTSNSILDDSS